MFPSTFSSSAMDLEGSKYTKHKTFEQEDSESEEEIVEKDKKMPIDDLISVMDTAIRGLEQRHFITEHELMSMYRIKEKLLNEKPKLMWQQSLKEMFKTISY